MTDESLRPDRAAMIDAGQLPPAPWTDEERARLSQLYPGMRYHVEGRPAPGPCGMLTVGGVPITGVQGFEFTPPVDPWANELAVKVTPMPEITIEGVVDVAELTVKCFVCGFDVWMFGVRRGELRLPGAAPVKVDVCEECAVALERANTEAGET